MLTLIIPYAMFYNNDNNDDDGNEWLLLTIFYIYA